MDSVSQRPRRYPLVLITLALSLMAPVGCSSDSSSGPADSSSTGGTGGNTVEPLSFFEEQLAGKWSRFHAFDGSTDYKIFKTDRTSCEWEKPSGGGRTNETNYVNWTLDEVNPIAPSVFPVLQTYSSGSINSIWEFDYPDDELRSSPGSLIHFHSSTTLDCSA